MKRVSFLFHIYQPPNQSDKVLKDITQQSYEPLARQILEFSDLKFTLNINYSLVHLLASRFPHVIDNIRLALENGNLELTATGAYHPIFPLLPASEVARQLALNERGNQQSLSPSFQPVGIFPPELALTCALIPLFKSLGYKWTITDDANLNYYGRPVPFDRIYTFDGFVVFFRSNHWANKFANYHNQWPNGKAVVADLISSLSEWMKDRDGYLIIALDGETFGHHHRFLNEVFIAEMFDALRANKDQIQTAHLSDLYTQFPHVSEFVPPGSWSTDEADIRNRDYFAWWQSRFNKVHHLQWRFTSHVLQVVRRRGDDAEVNNDLDRALYSCQYWWASLWKFNPGEIYKGAFNMMRVLQLAASDDMDLLEKGEDLFRELVTEVEHESMRRGV